jgi:hypothetical protein
VIGIGMTSTNSSPPACRDCLQDATPRDTSGQVVRIPEFVQIGQYDAERSAGTRASRDLVPRMVDGATPQGLS